MKPILDVFVPGRPVARPSGKLDLVRRRPGLRSWMDLVAMLARVHRVGPVYDGPVELDLVVLTPRTGDLSNFVKAIEDALNGNAWKDDRQVVSIRAELVRVADVERILPRACIRSRGPGANIVVTPREAAS